MSPLLIGAGTALLAASSLFAPWPARARADAGAPGPIALVEIVDRDTGERLPVYSHEGQRWVAGTPGHRYSVYLRNNAAGRILGVVSVDGVNAVTGETADWSQRGYVLAPAQEFEVLGWRKSQRHVADFVFSALESSYAARTGRPDNVGVIGVALFREATPVPAPLTSGSAAPGDAQGDAPRDLPPAAVREFPPTERSIAQPLPPAPAPSAAAGSSAPAAAAPETRAFTRPSIGSIARSGPLGTAHGPAETSVVYDTQFERLSPSPDQIVAIRYDRRERLIAMGVIVPAGGPKPFPGSGESGFVPDPPALVR
jgi:hypothetical protein